MVADVLLGLTAWFGASLVLGVLVGKLMASQDRSPWADAKQHSPRKAA